uniref:AAA family ATPase n=1 Tax=Catenulispora pinisilvae TaxID=2705253 RepID=UPI0018910664
MIGHRELVADLAARTADGAPTVLSAPPGRGKSALLDAVAEPWITGEDHVIWLTAAPADHEVPFAALADLLCEAPGLPAPWLEAIRQALRRIPGRPDRVAIRLAAKACVDSTTPPNKRVLLLADDTQWWDPDSLDALAYLARHGIPVVAATRPGGPVDFLGRDAIELPVPALTAEQTATLLQERGIGLRVAARVHAASGGNARLTVEISRGLDASSGALDVVTTPTAARRCVRGWIDELPTPDGIWRTLLITALAADPSVPTLRRTAGPDTLEALACAEQAGLIAVDVHGTVSFPATAVRDTVLADASQETLRTVHLLLAETATDSTARLWHRASAARDHPDLGVASELAVAARAVRRRGDPGRAAELWLLAAEMMPARDEADEADEAGEADAAGAADGSLAPLPAPVSGTANKPAAEQQSDTAKRPDPRSDLAPTAEQQHFASQRSPHIAADPARASAASEPAQQLNASAPSAPPSDLTLTADQPHPAQHHDEATAAAAHTVEQ